MTRLEEVLRRGSHQPAGPIRYGSRREEKLREYAENLITIWHAVDERDWERLDIKPFRDALEKLQKDAKILPSKFHPPIFPEEEAELLKISIENRDAVSALNAIAKLSFLVLNAVRWDR